MPKTNISKDEMYDIASVKDAIKVLKEIAYIGEPVGPRELARLTHSNPNKTFRLLKTLLGEGLIEKRGDKYGLGYGLAEIHAKYVHSLRKTISDAEFKLSSLGE